MGNLEMNQKEMNTRANYIDGANRDWEANARAPT